MAMIEGAPFTPGPASLELIQSCAGDIKPDDSALGDWSQNYAANHAKRIALDLEIIEAHADKSNTILEFGSIPLLLTVALKKLGYKVEGIDLDPGRFSSTISAFDLTVHKCDIEKDRLPLNDASFDVVIFNELFEHLRINPIFTLREVHRILKPGGTMLLSTPNMRSLRGIFNFLVRNKTTSASIFQEYSKLETIGHMGHVREYTTREVTDFLSKLGFNVTGMIFRGAYKSGFSKMACQLRPTLRPVVTYVARAEGSA